VHVFEARLPLEVAVLDLVLDFLQPALDGLALVGRDDARLSSPFAWAMDPRMSWA
jgi:hypothetical protein